MATFWLQEAVGLPHVATYRLQEVVGVRHVVLVTITIEPPSAQRLLCNDYKRASDGLEADSAKSSVKEEQSTHTIGLLAQPLLS